MKTTMRHLFILITGLTLAGCAILQPGPSMNTAVKELVEDAETYTLAGKLDQASASLERALRIEPRNSALWQELAIVRVDQGLYVQAENMAAKSNSLADGNRRLRKNNWRIISETRSKRGDNKGAQEALARAERE